MLAELESYLARLRNAASYLLDHDMWERWGEQHASEQDRAERAKQLPLALAERTGAIEGLTGLVARLRRESPATIADWADRHIALLTEFRDATADSTAKFVANEEIEKWGQVKAGALPFVDGNVFYVQIDPDRYHRIFGLP